MLLLNAESASRTLVGKIRASVYEIVVYTGPLTTWDETREESRIATPREHLRPDGAGRQPCAETEQDLWVEMVRFLRLHTGPGAMTKVGAVSR